MSAAGASSVAGTIPFPAESGLTNSPSAARIRLQSSSIATSRLGTTDYDNNHIDSHSLIYESLLASIAEGVQIHVRDVQYNYGLSKMLPNNILAIIYRGILDSIIRPHITLNYRFPTLVMPELPGFSSVFSPSNDLFITVLRAKLTFSSPQGPYFSLQFRPDGNFDFEIGDLAFRELLFPQGEPIISFRNINAQPLRWFPIEDFEAILRETIQKDPILFMSLQMLATFRYFFNFGQPISIVIEKFSRMDLPIFARVIRQTIGN